MNNGERCQWLICRGYHKGAQCGNDAPLRVYTTAGEMVVLCLVHLGSWEAKPACSRGKGKSLLVSEHGRWRDRKGNCRVCGRPADGHKVRAPNA